MVELEGFHELEGADRLQKIPIFRGLSYDETNALALLIRRQSAAAGTVLVEQNALGSALYLVVGGSVRVERKAHDIAAVEVLYLHRRPNAESAQLLVDQLVPTPTETDVELLAVDRAPFEKLLEKNERLAFKVYRAFCRQLSERLRNTNELLAGKAGLMGHTS